MHHNITGSGNYLQVATYGGSNYVNNYNGAVGVGNLRFNTSTQNMEVWDGYNWIAMNAPSTTISLNNTAEQAISWAIKKQQEEQELEELCRKHPGLQEVHEKYLVMLALTKVEDKNKENK